MKSILSYVVLTMLTASAIGQQNEVLSFDFDDPQVLVPQIEAALTNGVPCTVIVSNISAAASFEPVYALEACLDFDFATNDIVRTAEAFAIRVSAMGCLFGTNTYTVSSNLYSCYSGFCGMAFTLASRRDKSISEAWFAQHPLESIEESMSLAELMAAKTRNNELIADFGTFMDNYVSASNPTSAYWKIYYHYNKQIHFGPKFLQE